MAFNPGLKIGQEISNAELVSIFKCGNMGGMRRSHTTNTLVIVSDYTKGLYHDKWIGGVLHYTGMGKNGDQDTLSGEKTLIRILLDGARKRAVFSAFQRIFLLNFPAENDRISQCIYQKNRGLCPFGGTVCRRQSTTFT